MLMGARARIMQDTKCVRGCACIATTCALRQRVQQKNKTRERPTAKQNGKNKRFDNTVMFESTMCVRVVKHFHLTDTNKVHLLVGLKIAWNVSKFIQNNKFGYKTQIIFAENKLLCWAITYILPFTGF